MAAVTFLGLGKAMEKKLPENGGKRLTKIYFGCRIKIIQHEKYLGWQGNRSGHEVK